MCLLGLGPNADSGLRPAILFKMTFSKPERVQQLT